MVTADMQGTANHILSLRVSAQDTTTDEDQPFGHWANPSTEPQLANVSCMLTSEDILFNIGIKTLNI